MVSSSYMQREHLLGLIHPLFIPLSHLSSLLLRASHKASLHFIGPLCFQRYFHHQQISPLKEASSCAQYPNLLLTLQMLEFFTKLSDLCLHRIDESWMKQADCICPILGLAEHKHLLRKKHHLNEEKL